MARHLTDDLTEPPSMPTASIGSRPSAHSGPGVARAAGATAEREVDSIPEIEPELESVPPSIPSAAIAAAPGVLPAQPVLPGHVIAQRYEVINVLGEGGMGIVYRCRDQATTDLVAVKRVILPEGKLASEYIGWFYKEARALATLDHPGIVHARDFGQLADGSPFLAMDLVTGV
jgi:serine/threonine protein kinase